MKGGGQQNMWKVLARMFFRMRTEMFNCKMNRSSDRQNRVALWQCSGCGNIDTQAHIIWCPAYQDLREEKSLNSNTDLVHYFKKVMHIRETLDLGWTNLFLYLAVETMVLRDWHELVSLYTLLNIVMYMGGRPAGSVHFVHFFLLITKYTKQYNLEPVLKKWM